MTVPPTGAVLLLTAVFSVRGMVIVGPLVMFTVSDSGKLALIVTTPVLEFTCATAGVVNAVSAITSNTAVPRTLIEFLMFIFSTFAFRKYCCCEHRVWGYRTKGK